MLYLEKTIPILKKLTVFIALLCSGFLFSQSDALAMQYFEDGDFEKALVLYEKLYQKNPGRMDFLQYLIESHQQLERYQEAEQLLRSREESSFFPPNLLVELGYNYQLQGQQEKAVYYYEKAAAHVEQSPNFAFVIGSAFKKRALLDYALRVYERSIAVKPNTNIQLEIARIYGEMGNIEKMFSSYLELIQKNESYLRTITNRISQFLDEDPSSENNLILKKVLLEKLQSTPDLLWNEILSWLYVQQKQYKNAFIQEKAIFKRSQVSTVKRVMSLGLVCMEQGADEIAIDVFNYVIENSADRSIQLDAHLYITELEIANADKKSYRNIEEKFKTLILDFGTSAETISLQIAYARFLAFHLNKTQEAIKMLTESLDLRVSRFELAKLKINLGDILVYDEKFNKALIYFSQVQKALKNDVIAQTARFKVAKTSFYKGDFDWALTQLKVLRSSTTQLIANDAMQLSLLISDNSLEDSTKTALRIYAKADLMAYQNKNKEAITLLDAILKDHKGARIEDEALFKQATLLEKTGAYERAKVNYLKIIEFYGYDILADDALFALAQLYENKLGNPEKAREFYEKIIFNHPDSIYYVTSRKRYRALRGDAIN